MNNSQSTGVAAAETLGVAVEGVAGAVSWTTFFVPFLGAIVDPARYPNLKCEHTSKHKWLRVHLISCSVPSTQSSNKYLLRTLMFCQTKVWGGILGSGRGGSRNKKSSQRWGEESWQTVGRVGVGAGGRYRASGRQR